MGISIRVSRNTRISLPFGAALVVIPIWLAGVIIVVTLWLTVQFIVAIAKGITFLITFFSKGKDHEHGTPPAP